ncbi:MAG: TetR/AcrR family transcriptional regulator [Actinomycetota bacterium]|nr:TetR/AcrR family transcriptional regulator [Actinomycetota bacterium]
MVTAAIELLRERPWPDIEIRDVVRRAGMSPSTFYEHHRDRTDVARAVLAELVVPVTSPDDEPPQLEDMLIEAGRLGGTLSSLLEVDVTAGLRQRIACRWAGAGQRVCGVRSGELSAQLLAGAVVAGIGAIVDPVRPRSELDVAAALAALTSPGEPLAAVVRTPSSWWGPDGRVGPVR